MDNSTKEKFDKMAKCVINQYDVYKPLPTFHVDGLLTQGENIADNAGIRAAYNAFQAHQNFYGKDDLLPDDELSQFSHEQLFFLAFGRVWCGPPRDLEKQIDLLLTNVHAPPNFRIFGTLQNFPAFRSAFNCPVGTPYAPKDDNRCNVWASEVKQN